MKILDFLAELLKRSLAGLGEPRINGSPVFVAPETLDQIPLLQPVEQTGDVRVARSQVQSNVGAAQAVRLVIGQNAQHLELDRRKSMRPEQHVQFVHQTRGRLLE